MENKVHWHPRESTVLWTENEEITACLEGFICSCLLKENLKLTNYLPLFMFF